MAHARTEEHESFPKSGRVNEMCREWVVREDGALAYHLQHQEISDHLQGNRFRNAVVREDFPRALDEQIREQQLAEQAAAVYHQMLAEQEEGDILYAKKVADNLEREERSKRRLAETHDEFYARQLQETAIDISARRVVHQPLQKSADFPSPHRPDKSNYYANSPRRQALAMPLPNNHFIETHNTVDFEPNGADTYLYTEPYKPSDLINRFDQIDIAEVGLPLDEIEINDREKQQLKDEQLARELQEQEDSSEQSQLNRDRLLAIEAQDKELAKLLQERERQKAKRARERAKQRALAKKQQQAQMQDIHQIMPDDSYSTPADLLPVPQNIIHDTQMRAENTSVEEDLNYSFPADVLSHKNADYNLKQNYSPQKTFKTQYQNQDHMKNLNSTCVENTEIKQSTAVRPTQLDLKSTNYPNKPRYPSPSENSDKPQSPAQHTNIAMAIDPTYNRRSQHSVPYYDTSSTTVTTSTSSSSPGMLLPPPDLPEEEDDGPIPPYMPIQGQRRTSSLEKKAKKKSKDGCKQQ